MGFQTHALSAIDIALWDIPGKVADLSLSTLLGGVYRDSVRVYHSTGGVADRHREDVMRSVLCSRIQQGR